MKILICTGYFWPEAVGAAPMVTDLAEFLAERHDVTVVAARPKLPSWEVPEAYRGKWLVREKLGKVKVLHTWAYVPPKPRVGLMKAWRRILFDSSIAAAQFPVALGTGRPDLIVSITPPLQTAVTAIALKTIWRCPVVNWIQDIVPDAALNLGMMREGFTLRVARALERFVYRHADHIAVISEGFRENLMGKGVASEKILRLTNFVDVARFDVASERDAYRARLGIAPDDFVLMHGGSLAAKQVLENVVRAMKLLEAHREIRFFFVGDGIRKEALVQEIAKLNVGRISFLPTTTGLEYVQTLRAADVLVLNQARDLVDALVPSKLLTYLPARRPVIAAVNERSEAARFVREAHCGVLVPAENPEAFAAAVLDIKARPKDCRRMAESGDRFVREHYAKDKVLREFEAFLLAEYHS